ncbi:RpnC/YadD family protein [Streptomyces edwardsiae]|uniref:Transposase n=1 Tax=Streptomyces edwardsiae TaxID=3075527 RepID=A0ABU2QB94_9ACTN|nr:hypothetical protein [Streptomyces sp. DSM 41635]MDT0401693.1 hypothetical protein [Streptomyces sp. DSM 41635]
MPNVSHDTLHGFLPGRPKALNRALDLLDLGIPTGVTTETLPTDASGAPKMFARQMDSVLRVVRPDGRDPFILLVEAQTRIESKKETSWPYYVAYLRDRYKLEVVLLVLCVDTATAAWAARPLRTGLGRPTQVTVPHVLGPSNVPRMSRIQDASADLDFAAFCVWIHSNDPDIEGILTVVGEALAQDTDREARDDLAGLIEDGLGSEHARKIWRNLMETLFTPRQGTIVGDARLAGQEEGRQEGRVAGKAEQLLRLMERRGFCLTEETRQRVITCADMPLLDLWFDRAIDATTLDEIFAAPSSTDRVPAPAQSPEDTAVAGQGPRAPGSSTN